MPSGCFFQRSMHGTKYIMHINEPYVIILTIDYFLGIALIQIWRTVRTIRMRRIKTVLVFHSTANLYGDPPFSFRAPETYLNVPFDELSIYTFTNMDYLFAKELCCQPNVQK